MVVDKGLMSLSVTWDTPELPNGIITHYTVSIVVNKAYIEIMANFFISQVKYDNHTKTVAVEDVKPSVMLSQLQPDTSYNITVSASTAIGEGDAISIIVSTGKWI